MYAVERSKLCRVSRWIESICSVNSCFQTAAMSKSSLGFTFCVLLSMYRRDALQNMLQPQMAFSKLALLLCNCIGRKGHQRVKDDIVLTATALNALGSIKEGALGLDMAGSSSTEVDTGECCCVCLAQMEVGDCLRVLPCLHKFHEVCIKRWLDGCCRRTCPLCRFSLGEDEKSEEEQQLTMEMVMWFSSFHVAGF